MTRPVDVAVIGGGIAGTSTAALLAAAGMTVRLYERSAIAAGASGRNSGVVQHPFDPVLADLYRRSVAEYRRAEAALDGAFALSSEPAGLMFVGRDEAVAARAARDWAATWPETQPTVLEGPALVALEPGLAPGLAACRLEMGYPVAPAAATEAFATLARRSGAEVVLGDRATIASDRGRAVGADVGGRVEPAGVVVVAAGPWSPEVIDPAGRWLPIRPVWGVVASVRVDGLPRHGLEAVDIDVEPREDGLRASAASGHAADVRDEVVDFSLAPGVGVSALGSTFLPDEPDPQAWVDALRRVGARYVPALATAPVVGVRHCARPVSRDGRPLLGRLPWLDGAWVIAGHGPWGISTGPGSAALLADAILGRANDLPEPLAVGRFGDPTGDRGPAAGHHS